MTADPLVDRLRAAGCVAADDEARDLRAVARDDVHLDALVRRREEGEPLAWITGSVLFCGITVAVHPGVYVPRWQSEALARCAVERLPRDGVALDLCCGSGAISRVLADRRPHARVFATDVDPAAVVCAQANGVDARVGDLYEPVDDRLRGTVDVVVAVPPYVPTHALALLARTPEPTVALDGGRDGLEVARRVVSEAPEWLRAGGALMVEVGRPQVHAMHAALTANGFRDVAVLHDPEGDVCGMSGRFQEGR